MYCSGCTKDFFEFFAVSENKTSGELWEKKISQECSPVAPGPLVTDGDTNRAKARFVSSPREPGQGAPPGFRAKYQFRERSDQNGNSLEAHSSSYSFHFPLEIFRGFLVLLWKRLARKSWWCAGSSCFMNLTKRASGPDEVIRSEGFPYHPYKKDLLCEWHLHASHPSRRILIFLEKYHIEKLDG